jgi:hypothetical protein
VGGGGGGGGQLRRANPVPLARSAGRSTSAWARRPTGRVAVPAIIGILLLGVAGTAGAYLVPQALQADATPSATPPVGATGAELPVPSGPAVVPSLPAASGGPAAGSAPPSPGRSGGRAPASR